MGIDSHTPTWWLEWAPELSAKASEVLEQAPGGRRGRGLTPRREAAKRLGMAQVPQLPRMFCGHEGVLECSGLTELWMGSSASMGNPKRCPAPALQETRIRLNFWKMITFAVAKIETTLGGLTRVSLGPGAQARDPLYWGGP
jgi:hypothetical protein